MIPLGLHAADLASLESQMRSSARIRVSVEITDLEGEHATDVSSRVLDGQVNIDTTAETTRQLSLTLDDPHRELSIDSDSPSDGALYVDRMMRVHYGLYVDKLARWVDVPIFAGPIVTMQRDAATVAVSCLGKEYLAKGSAWRPMSFKKGHNVVDAIKDILRERAGEKSFAFPKMTARLPDKLAIGRTTQPWAIASSLAAGLGRQLYYDGAGVCRLRRPPSTSLFTFSESVVLTDASVTYDVASVRNVVWVKGHKPKNKPRISAFVTAPQTHPLSPQRLGRNDRGRYLVEIIEKDSVRSVKDARQLARRALNGFLLEGVTASFDALPIVHLDPLDVVQLKSDEASITFPLRQASIPLTHGGVMSVGAVKRVSINRKAIR